jgi:site-specific recombinase XerD
MGKYNATNVRMIWRYKNYLFNTGRYTQKTIDQKLKALENYQKITNYKDFSRFTLRDVEKYKEQMSITNHNPGSSNYYSIHTVANWRNHVKHFFLWLITQKGYKHLPKSDIEYLNLNKDEFNTLKNYMAGSYPSYEIIKKLFESINDSSEIGKRDKFLVAFLFLTGIRTDALISLPVKAIDTKRKVVFQNPGFKVRTKRNKKFASIIMNFDQEMQNYVFKYIDFLLKEKMFGSDAPVFPATLLEHKEGTYCYEASKLVNDYYKTSQAINNVLRQRFKVAGMDYYRPHSFRHANAYYAPRACKNALEFKAVSEHLGHSSILTSLSSYSRLNEDMVISILIKMDFSLDKKADDFDINIEEIQNLPEAFQEIVRNLIKQNKDQNGF